MFPSEIMRRFHLPQIRIFEFVCVCVCVGVWQDEWNKYLSYGIEFNNIWNAFESSRDSFSFEY